MSETSVITCSACGAINRVTPGNAAPGRQAVCGRCKNPLPAKTSPMIVTDATFASEVERSPLPALVDLWAPWCGPCHMLAPVIDQLATEMAGRVRVAKVNIDENPVTAARFNVRGIPALLVMKGGQEIDRIVGVQPKAEIIRRLEQLLP